MEKNNKLREHMPRLTVRHALSAIGLVSVILLSGCGEEKPTTPETSVTVDQILALEQSVRLEPGDVKLVEPISADAPRVAQLIDELPIVSHIYPHGISDENAPTISDIPQRLETQVKLHGSKSNYLDQDAACDTLNIERSESVSAIGALSIGDEDQLSIVSWPKEVDGTNGNEAYVCVFQNIEPSEGIVVFTQQ